MAQPATKPTSLDEFLGWEDGTEMRYELIGGFPVAMTPPAETHRKLASRINAPLSSRRPCIRNSRRASSDPSKRTPFLADIAATYAENEPGRQAIKQWSPKSCAPATSRRP